MEAGRGGKLAIQAGKCRFPLSPKAEDAGRVGESPSRSCYVPTLRKALRWWVSNPLPSTFKISASAGSVLPALIPSPISISRSFASGKVASARKWELASDWQGASDVGSVSAPEEQRDTYFCRRIRNKAVKGILRNCGTKQHFCKLYFEIYI